MKVKIVLNKGYEGILEIGEVYEVIKLEPNKLYIKVNGNVINLKTVTYRSRRHRTSKKHKWKQIRTQIKI